MLGPDPIDFLLPARVRGISSPLGPFIFFCWASFFVLIALATKAYQLGVWPSVTAVAHPSTLVQYFNGGTGSWYWWLVLYVNRH